MIGKPAVLTALLLLVAWLPPGPAASESPRSSTKDRIVTHLDTFDRRAADSSASLDTRDLADAALLALLSGRAPSRAEMYMTRLFAAQDSNEGSPTYGNFRWRTADAGVTDRNAVEFVSQALGPVALQSSEEFSPSFKQQLDSVATAAIAGIRRHNVPVTYTNVYLMKCVNLLLLGRYRHDPDAVATGRRLLDAWRQYTQANGIAEFDSPTYYAVDLNTLVEGARYAASPEDRAALHSVLDYFWNDIAANYLPSAHKLTGPYSRDYDFVSGYGDLNNWVAEAGWLGSSYAAPLKNLQDVFILDNSRPGGYHVPAQTTRTAFSGERNVISTWDPVPTHVRWNWLNTSISVGCANGSYGPQDKMFNITFAGSPEYPQMSIVVDAYQAPYGLGTQFTKSEHLSPQMACSARRGNVLATLNLDPSALPANAQGLTTNVLFPLAATVRVNGSSVPVSPEEPIALHQDDTISVQTPQGGVALRIVSVDGIDGHAPEIALVTDAAGKTRGVGWLRITHLPNGTRTAQRNLHVAFLFQASASPDIARQAADVRQARVDAGISGSVWRVRATTPQGTLEVARSAISRGVIFHQSFGDMPGERAPLRVRPVH